jgi:protease-4
MAIKRLNKIKPVITYASGSLTSGSYYASIWTREIIANPGAFIGSIGVMIQTPNIEELAKKLGISEQTIVAGEYKQMGTFTREWSKKERGALEDLINDAYELFIGDVARARGLRIEDAKEFANARVFIAQKAKEVGLIDRVGSLYIAQRELEKMSGVAVPIWQKPSEIELFLKELKTAVSLPIFSFGSYLR